MRGRESSELVDFLLALLTLFICLARLLFYSDETRIPQIKSKKENTTHQAKKIIANMVARLFPSKTYSISPLETLESF